MIPSAPVRGWRERLAAIPDQERFIAEVIAAERAVGLTYKDAPAMHVAEPCFVPEATIRADQHVADAVLTSLVAAGDTVMADPVLRERYLGQWLATTPDVDLFELSPGYSPPVVLGRLDAVRLSDGLQILEFNGGLPGGMMPADGAAGVMSGLPMARDFEREFPFRTMSVVDSVLTALVAAWHDYGGAGTPFIVVALPTELGAVATPALAHLARAGAARGVEIEVSDPGPLTHRDGRLQVAGRPIDVLVRGFFTPMITYLGERLDGIRSALRAGDLCMITSLRAGLYGHKCLFAAVTDPAVELPIPADTLALARAHTPWTRLAVPGTTTDPDGAVVELADFILVAQEHLVIKPSEGYGGAGVELGWEHTADSWRAVRDSALADGGCVVQSRVAIGQEEFSALAPGFPVTSYTADHNPIIANGVIAGYYVRLASDSAITNVTAGSATVAPTFVLTG